MIRESPKASRDAGADIASVNNSPGTRQLLPRASQPLHMLSDCDWQAFCRDGRERLCHPL